LEDAFDRVEEANEALTDLQKIKHKPAVFASEGSETDFREIPARGVAASHFSQDDLKMLKQLEIE